MKSLLFVLLGVSLTVTCWGVYGPILHKGQARLFTTAGGQTNDRLKPLICVGLSYFVVAIIVPIVILGGRGELTEGWSMGGITWSMLAGTAGALGALGIILASSMVALDQFLQNQGIKLPIGDMGVPRSILFAKKRVFLSL